MVVKPVESRPYTEHGAFELWVTDWWWCGLRSSYIEKSAWLRKRQKPEAMVKAYLRYEAAATFGVVASTAANVALDASGKLLVSAALENVLVWNIRQGAAVSALQHSKTS